MHNLNQPIINNLQLDLLVNKGCNNICLWILGRTKKTEIEFTLAEIALSPTCAKDSWQALAIYSLTFPFTQRTFPKPITTWQSYIWPLNFCDAVSKETIRRTKLKRKRKSEKCGPSSQSTENFRRNWNMKTASWETETRMARFPSDRFPARKKRDQNKYLLPRLDSWEPWRHFLSHCLVSGKNCCYSIWIELHVLHRSAPEGMNVMNVIQWISMLQEVSVVNKT